MAYSRKVYKREAEAAERAEAAEKSEALTEAGPTVTTSFPLHHFERHHHKLKATTVEDLDGTEAPTKSSTTKPNIITKVDKTLNKGFDKAAEVTKLPKWGVVGIFVLILLLVCGLIFFCVRRFFRKRRGKDGKKGMKGADLKSVQLLGSAYKEKVQPDMEELTENAEEPDDGESKHSEQKLGKLQYKVFIGY